MGAAEYRDAPAENSSDVSPSAKTAKRFLAGSN